MNLNHLRYQFFVCQLVSYFTLFYLSKFHYKSKCILIIFLVFFYQITYYSVSLQSFKSKINFDTTESNITRPTKWWVHSYWFVCKRLNCLSFLCFFCLLVGYCASFSRSKCYYKSKVILVTFFIFDPITYYSVLLQSLESKIDLNNPNSKRTQPKKLLLHSYWFFLEFKMFMLSVFSFSIGGLFYIIFMIKMLLQIKIQTHIYLFLLFLSNHFLLCFILIAQSQKWFQ